MTALGASAFDWVCDVRPSGLLDPHLDDPETVLELRWIGPGLLLGRLPGLLSLNRCASAKGMACW